MHTVALLLFALSGPAHAAEPVGAAPIPQEVSVSSWQSAAFTSPAGTTMQVHTLRSPTSGARPLVLALHWGDPNAGKAHASAMAQPGLAALDATLVAPDCPGRGWADPKSEEAVVALLDELVADDAIDARKVVVMGTSMGGIGTWHLASRHPERFAAALPLSSRPPPITSLAVPTYVIHGSADEVFPPAATRDAVAALKDQGADVTFVEVQTTGHFDLAPVARALSAAVPWIESTLKKRRRSK